MELDPLLSNAFVLGGLAAAWAIIVYVLSRILPATGEPYYRVRLLLSVISLVTSCVCLFLILRIPDWRLMWIRWTERDDYCALPGHAALYWFFIDGARFAFAAPVFAYIAFRLADSAWFKAFSLISLVAATIVLALTIHGLHRSTFWPL
jgi:hypothetical protein